MELAFPTDVPQRNFTRAEFEHLVSIGFFRGEHTELLYGRLVTMTIGPAHADVSVFLVKLLIKALGDRASVRPQIPLAASDMSEPEPDIAIVAPGRYRDEHPSQALWVIEISDSTLAKDLGVKARLYAETSVPEYWVVNVEDECIEVHTQPVDGRYLRVESFGAGKTVAPAAFPDVTVSVDALFG